MVLLRFIFQVALGLWGFFPSTCYASQERLDHQRSGAFWGSPRLADAGHAAEAEDSSSSSSSEDAASEPVSRASASGADGASGKLQGLPSRRGMRVRSPKGSVERKAAQEAKKAPSLPIPSAYGDLALPGISSGYEDGSPGEEEDSTEDETPLAFPKTDMNASLSLIDALGSGNEEALNSLSAALQRHSALAELFRRLSFGAAPFQNPQLKTAVEVQAGRLTSSALTMCGRRDQDEDVVLVEAQLNDSPYVVKGVFDGHGGRFSSQFCSSNIHNFLTGLKEATPQGLSTAFLALDYKLLKDFPNEQSGSTGVVALIKEVEEPREFLVSGREIVSSESSETLFESLNQEDKAGSPAETPKRIVLGGPEAPAFLVTLANVGDSRATLLHANGGFTVLSRDHKPTDPEELKRIEGAGGFVANFPFVSIPRVDGVLALSRAFGDGSFKQTENLGQAEQRVVAVPDVHTFYALPGDVLMLACDGVYEPEKMNWVFVSHFMSTLLYELKNDLTEAGVKLLEHAYQSFSGDNISVLLTRFEREESAVRKMRRFQVSPTGHILAANPPDVREPELSEKDEIEALKGSLRATDENPILL